jgi:hypothetical protein
LLGASWDKPRSWSEWWSEFSRRDAGSKLREMYVSMHRRFDKFISSPLIKSVNETRIVNLET